MSQSYASIFEPIDGSSFSTLDEGITYVKQLFALHQIKARVARSDANRKYFTLPDQSRLHVSHSPTRSWSVVRFVPPQLVPPPPETRDTGLETGLDLDLDMETDGSLTLVPSRESTKEGIAGLRVGLKRATGPASCDGEDRFKRRCPCGEPSQKDEILEALVESVRSATTTNRLLVHELAMERQRYEALRQQHDFETLSMASSTPRPPCRDLSGPTPEMPLLKPHKAYRKPSPPIHNGHSSKRTPQRW